MMNKKNLPALRADNLNAKARFEVPESVMARWNRGIQAKNANGEASISIFDVIGEDWDGSGFTDAKCAGILRSLGGADVTVYINSPGGSLFHGIAIYNMLREYEGRVTVRVLGMAASAASVAAMAGDEVQIAKSAFFMIHNCWCLAVGNANDLRNIAAQNDEFDEVMAQMYVARTGLDLKQVQTMMDAETWINGTSAVDQGFADNFTPADQIEEGKGAKASAIHRLDSTLAKAGMSRTERRSLIQEIKGTPGAVQDGTPSAAFSAADAAHLLSLTANFGAAARA
ncbi:ATP-dependent protease ClpP protease subunit [Comamonas odontotermitis]|uniref:ATP-dependent Clp protease proteolytic subunit n=2 Tax=Comamonas odontotermitis TaxID=379895 RepID=A0ABR6RFQ8_9BURK|nr:ATP-dependent protease ClpP protease subunit [Comamonas odontotermitis]